LDPVQGIDAVNDLFERSVRNDPCKNRLCVEDWLAVDEEPTPIGPGRAADATWLPAKACDESFVRQYLAGVSACRERAIQLVGVPTCAGTQDGDIHGSGLGAQGSALRALSYRSKITAKYRHGEPKAHRSN